MLYPSPIGTSFCNMRRAALSLLRRSAAISSRTSCAPLMTSLADASIPANYAMTAPPTATRHQRWLAGGPAQGAGSGAAAGGGGSASTPSPSTPPSMMDVTSLQDFQALLQLSSRVAVILQVGCHAHS